MAADSDQEGTGAGDADSLEATHRWDGYSDYREISLRMARSIDRALDAYARIEGAHAEQATVSPAQAAEARSRIHVAAIKLIPELEHDREDVDVYDEILEKWTGDDGYIQQLDAVTLRDECPGWLFDMVTDMRTAGWELGYLQAGRVESEPADPVEAETEDMFAEL
jgi:hypothetical protein